MAVNALPPTPGPVNSAPAAPGGERKGEETAQDPTFASLLATLISPMLQVNPLLAAIPAPGTAPETGNSAPQAVMPQGAAPSAGQPMQSAAAMLIPAATADQPAPAQQTPNMADFAAALQAAQAQSGVQPDSGPTETAQAAAPLVVPVPPQEVAHPVEHVLPVAEAAPQLEVPAAAAEPQAVAQAAAQSPAQAVAQAEAPTVIAPAVPGAAPKAEQKAEPRTEQPELPAPEAGPAPAAPRVGEPAPVTPVATAAREVRIDGRHTNRDTAPEKPLQPSLHNLALQPAAPRAPEPERPLEHIPTPIEPARLMDAIGQSLSTARPGHYTVTLQLYPDNLGEVRLQLQLVGKEVHTVMQVSNPAAKQALEDRTDQLRQSLGQSGLTLTGFQVSTGPGNQTPQERRNQLSEQLAAQRRPGPIRSVQAVARPASVQRIGGRDRTGGVLDTLA